MSYSFYTHFVVKIDGLYKMAMNRIHQWINEHRVNQWKFHANPVKTLTEDFRLLWNRLYLIRTLFWQFLRHRCELMVPCFILDYRQKNIFIAVKHRKILWKFEHVPLNAYLRLSDLYQFLKYLPNLLARALLFNHHLFPFSTFSLPFLAWSSHLVNHCDVRRGNSYYARRLNSSTEYFIVVNEGADVLRNNLARIWYFAIDFQMKMLHYKSMNYFFHVDQLIKSTSYLCPSNK